MTSKTVTCDDGLRDGAASLGMSRGLGVCVVNVILVWGEVHSGRFLPADPPRTS